MTRCAPHGRTTQSLPCVKGGGIVCTGFLPCHSEPVTDVTGVGIRSPRPQARNTPRLSLRGRCQRAALTEGLSKGIFRAGARGTFALGGKSTQKRRSNLRFENPFARLHPPRILTAFATRTLCPANFTEMLHRHCFSFRCRFCSEMQGFTAMSKTLSNQRPKAATYLCRFAAKARFDNRPNPRRVFPKREGTHRPKAVEKEDSVKETHQGFLSRSVKKPIFALQKS